MIAVDEGNRFIGQPVGQILVLRSILQTGGFGVWRKVTSRRAAAMSAREIEIEAVRQRVVAEMPLADRAGSIAGVANLAGPCTDAGAERIRAWYVLQLAELRITSKLRYQRCRSRDAVCTGPTTDRPAPVRNWRQLNRRS